MVITLYYNPASPPSRNADMVCKTLGLNYERQMVDLQKGDHKTSEYLKLNPRGKIPCLKDGDFVVSESRAIATYLCNRYEKGDDSSRLYPTDPKTRGLVDQMLYVSENTNDAIIGYVNIGGVIFGKDKGPNESKLDGAEKALDLYDAYLDKKKFMVGDHLTLADFFMASPLWFLPMADYKETSKHQKTFEWLKRVKSVKHFKECNEEGINIMTTMYRGKQNA